MVVVAVALVFSNLQLVFTQNQDHPWPFCICLQLGFHPQTKIFSGFFVYKLSLPKPPSFSPSTSLISFLFLLFLQIERIDLYSALPPFISYFPNLSTANLGSCWYPEGLLFTSRRTSGLGQLNEPSRVEEGVCHCHLCTHINVNKMLILLI